MKSSFCASSGCVDVAFVNDSDGSWVEVRNTKSDLSALVFTHEEWEAFVKGVKAGEFNIPAREHDHIF